VTDQIIPDANWEWSRDVGLPVMGKGPVEVTGTYDGHRYEVAFAMGGDTHTLSLDEDQAQRLGAWLSFKAADDLRRHRQDQRFRGEP
jgi:hypothetical protein